MTFIMTNGSPACFARSWEQAVDILESDTLISLAESDLTQRDWANIEQAMTDRGFFHLLEDLDACKVEIWAVAC